MSYYRSTHRTSRNADAAEQGSDMLPGATQARHSIAAVQHALGNQAVQQIARTGEGAPLVHPANDVYEMEAERVAQHAADPSAQADAPSLRTGPSVQRKSTSAGGAIAPETAGGTSSAVSGSGTTLDPATRTMMESRIGYDFGSVRVHTNDSAADSAAALNARAYTAGSDIVFGRGEYRPETREGQRLIAHELAHVAQQRTGISRQAKEGDALLAHELPHVLQQTSPQQPAQAQQTPAPPTCTAQKTPQQALADHNVRAETLFRMERAVTMAGQRTPTKFSSSLLTRADAAIQAEYGSLITKTPSYASAFSKPTKDASVASMAPDAFAKMRVPDDAAALAFIADLAMKAAPEAMAEACITSSSHPALISDVAQPILTAKGLSFVQDYVKSSEGGRTTFSDADALKSGVKAVFQDNVANLGHIIVHEAMHYYVADAFRVEARKRSDHLDLMEGGAEHFARNVISNQLASDPDFAVHDATYSRHISYIAAFSIMQRLWFPAMYFQGRTDLLALITPP